MQYRPPSPRVKYLSWQHLVIGVRETSLILAFNEKNLIQALWFVAIRSKELPLSKPNVYLVKGLLHLAFFWPCQQINVNAWRTDKYVFSGGEVADELN